MLKTFFTQGIGLSDLTADLWCNVTLFFVLCVVLAIVVMLGAHAAIRADARERDRAPPPLGIGRVSGAAPALPVPGQGPECGGKFCELRGCAILGRCGAPDHG